MDTSTRIIITGGSGFIGSALTNALIHRGFSNITIVDIEQPPADVNGVEFIKCDISSHRCRNTLAERSSRNDAIVHLAAITDVKHSEYNPYEAYATNALGTFNMLEYARTSGATRFIYASSAAVYGDPVRLPMPETHPLQPVSVYGFTKLLGEEACNFYRNIHGIDTISFRLFNVYGPNMRRGVILIFIKSILNKSRPVLYGFGRNIRDFVFIDDVVNAIILSINSSVNGVFNVGTGIGTRIIELYEVLCKISSRYSYRCPEPVLEGERSFDVQASIADISSISSRLGWRPRVGLEDGLKRTFEYYMGGVGA